MQADLTVDEEAAVSALMTSLTDLVKTRGIVVKAFFRDFDRANSGSVTRAQFEREIRRCFPALVDVDVAVLVKRYATNGGKDVKYRDLHNDVTPGEVHGCTLLCCCGARPSLVDVSVMCDCCVACVGRCRRRGCPVGPIDQAEAPNWAH